MSNIQDLRFQRTNLLLINAFTELLSEKKFEDITINELCERALIRRATFYTHFYDKYEFFAYYIQRQSNIFSKDFPNSNITVNPNDYFLYMCRQLVRYLSDNMTMVKNALNSSAFPILLSILSEQIYKDLSEELKINNHSSNNDASSKTIAAFYAGGLILIIKKWLEDKNQISEEELINQISLLIKFHPMNPDRSD